MTSFPPRPFPNLLGGGSGKGGFSRPKTKEVWDVIVEELKGKEGSMEITVGVWGKVTLTELTAMLTLHEYPNGERDFPDGDVLRRRGLSQWREVYAGDGYGNYMGWIDYEPSSEEEERLLNGEWELLLRKGYDAIVVVYWNVREGNWGIFVYGRKPKGGVRHV